MKRGTIPCCAMLVVALACGNGEEPAPQDTEPVEDTTAMTPGGVEAGGAVAETGAEADAEEDASTMGGETTTATTTTATGAPAPPGGYAVESRPAEGGKLAKIEYASPRTVDEIAAFYDDRIQAPRKVDVEVAGENVVAYALSSGTTLSTATGIRDVERLLDQRSEPIVVVSPWRIQRDDPLIRDLRDAGLADQADQLLDTKSKISVVYAVR